MNCESLGRHVTIGIEIDVEGAGRDPVEQFDTAKFDNPMPLNWIETCRFDVQNDFAHDGKNQRITLSVLAF